MLTATVACEDDVSQYKVLVYPQIHMVCEVDVGTDKKHEHEE